MFFKIIYKLNPLQKMLTVVFTVVLGMTTIVLLTFSNIETQHELSTAKELTLQVKINILSLRRHEKDFISRDEAQYLDKFKNTFVKLQNNVHDLQFILKEIGIDDITFEEFNKNLQDYKKYFFSFVSKKVELKVAEEDGNYNHIMKIKHDMGLTHNDGLHGSMRNSVHKTKAILSNSTQQLNKLFKEKVDHDKYMTIILSIFILLFIFYIASLVLKTVVDTFRVFKDELNGFFKYLNRESSELKLLDESSNGTVGELARGVNQFIIKTQKQIKDDEKVLQEFIDVFSKVGYGDLSCRVNIKSTNPNFEVLKDISNSMIENLNKNIQRTLHVLNHYANQDYRSEIETKNLHCDFKQLADGVNGLKGAVVMLIKENQENANLLKSHSTNLSHHVDRLSQTSAHQKESMGKSQEYFESISQNIANGNSSIKEMAELTSHLLTSVDEGLKLVGEADISMGLIDAQAKQIDKTLIIIDEIALQTSILSLNASVEAVSAGEAGKGFAVVAKEVRTLADKSTQAANQIKEIVRATSEKIASGQDVTYKLTKEFDDLSSRIHNTTEHINDLSDNMQKQDSILENINSSMPKLQSSIDDNGCIASKTDKIVTDIDGIVKTIVESTKKQVF